MSRVGKLPIAIPTGVEVSLKDALVVVKGPKGELKEVIPPHVSMRIEGNEIIVSVEHELEHKSFWGLGRALVANMVQGVTEGFKKELELNGVGYRAQMKGKTLVLSIGFSHPVEIEPLDGVEIAVENELITVFGPDRQKVGQTAALIRKVRPVEPYKGKGLKYKDEYVLRKEGKKAVGGGGPGA